MRPTQIEVVMTAHFRTKLTLLLLILALFAGACAKREQEPMVAADAPAPMRKSEAGGDPMAADGAETTSGKPGVAPQERMVIKTASVTIQSDAPEDAAAKARGIVESAGGFIVQSDTQSYGSNANQVTLVARVPAEKFDATLDQLRKLGKPTFESIRGEDVTEEYVDVQAQLRNQKQLEARFLALLETAQTVAETLEIERELARVRTEIDRLEGRSKFLRDQVAMSTINVTVQPAPKLFDDEGPKLGEEIVDAFSDAADLVVVVIGGLIRVAGALLPIGVLLALAGLVVRWLWRRRKSRG